jgi:hypothetical protein
METRKKVFRSRISVVIAAFMLASFILASLPLYYISPVIGIICIAPAFLLTLGIFTGIRYVIINENLYIKTWGICSAKIRITDILSVKRSYNLLSSPAASLKRLRLYCEKKSKHPYCLISPVCEQEFFDTLKSIHPDIDIQVPETRGKWRIWDWDI